MRSFLRRHAGHRLVYVDEDRLIRDAEQAQEWREAGGYEEPCLPAPPPLCRAGLLALPAHLDPPALPVKGHREGVDRRSARVTEKQPVQQGSKLKPEEKQNVLFLCSRNQWRSPSAEQIWRKHPRLSVRSAGTSAGARRRVSVEDVRWADVILVMEETHKSRLVAEFTRLLEGKPIHVLDIPDEYRYMDPELVEQLEQSVAAVLGLD